MGVTCMFGGPPWRLPMSGYPTVGLKILQHQPPPAMLPDCIHLIPSPQAVKAKVTVFPVLRPLATF